MSLHKARYFGDALNLRVNLEQDSDPETLQIVKELHWDHGSIIINHRIIHGGLLPAVVESWYPHSNDSYGLILEDDVELSPLFYAWVKMSILRYRFVVSVGDVPSEPLNHIGMAKKRTDHPSYSASACINKRT